MLNCPRLIPAALVSLCLLLGGCAPAASAPPPPASAAPISRAATVVPTVVAPAAATAAVPAAGLAPRPAPLDPPVTLQVGQLRGAGELMLFIANARGYWREEGLDVQLVDFRTSSDMVAPMASGELDVGAGGINAGFFNAAAQGIPFKVVADKGAEVGEGQNCAWMVRSELLDSGQVREPADVRGLNFGVGSVGSIIQIQIARILELGGLQEDDINIKQVGFPDQVVAFSNKSIDIAYVFEPTRTRLIEEGIARVWRTCAQLIPNQETVVLVYGPNMERKQEAGRRFMVGYLRGVRAFLDEGLDPRSRTPGLIDLAIQETPLKDPALWAKLALQWANPDGCNFRDSLEHDLRWFNERGFVPRAPRLDDILDQSYVDYALSRLGRYGGGAASSCS